MASIDLPSDVRGLSCNRRILVYGLVYDRLEHVLRPILRISFICPPLDWDMQSVKLTVLNMRGDWLVGVSARRLVLLLILFLVKEGKNVGNVAQSQKSPENSQ